MDPERYETRINRAIALIDREIDQDLGVERLAREACLSPFHFHRIFSALTGESVHAMTTRMRMQRALALANRSPRPRWKTVAAAVGYRSPTVFARAFKRHFGCPPARFDLAQWWRSRPDREAALAVSSHFLRPAPPLPDDFRVEIVARPAARRLVSRAIGGYLHPDRLVAACERLFEAAAALGIALPGRLAGSAWDDPECVPLARCRYDFTLEVPEAVRAPRGLCMDVRPAGRWAMVRVAGDLQAVDRAWNLLFKRWLPAAGLALRDAPAEEIYRRTPAEIGWHRFDLDLAIPVEDP